MVDDVNRYYHMDHSKTCDPEDFWGQVKRTVNGKPVTQDQIDLIVAAVSGGLGLMADDVLVDFCCGNGALTTLLFARCRGGLGIDMSEHLISVASRHFRRPPHEDFILSEATSYAVFPKDAERFTKGLCYGSFQYMTRSSGRELLGLLRRNFPNMTRFYIGNLPDRSRIDRFYVDGVPGNVDEPVSPIGIWYSPQELADLAAEAGWRASFHHLPSDYHAAHYRIDMLLTPC